MSARATERAVAVRAVRAGVEWRDASDGEDGILGTARILFSPANEWTEIASMWEGNFMERFAPGAWRKTISENLSRIRSLFQHGRDPQIGDKPLGPIRKLEETPQGGYGEVALLDTSYNRDLLPGLKAGLYGASHRFTAMREEVVEDPQPSAMNPRGIPERTVKEARLTEFGPVTFPAYAGATAGVRSLTDEFLLGCFDEDPERLRAMFESARDLRPRPRGAAPAREVEQRLSVDPNSGVCPGNLPYAVMDGGTLVACHASLQTAQEHADSVTGDDTVKSAPADPAATQRALVDAGVPDDRAEAIVRMDSEDVGLLAEMLTCASTYVAEQDEDTPAEAAARQAMQAIQAELIQLLTVEAVEDEPDEADEADAGRDAPPKDAPSKTDAATSTSGTERREPARRKPGKFTLTTMKESHAWRLTRP